MNWKIHFKPHILWTYIYRCILYVEYLTLQTFMTGTCIKGRYKWIGKTFSNHEHSVICYICICESTDVHRIFDTTNLYDNYVHKRKIEMNWKILFKHKYFVIYVRRTCIWMNICLYVNRRTYIEYLTRRTYMTIAYIKGKSTSKWCQIISLGYMSMPKKSFVIILIFWGSRSKNAWFIMYIIYIIKISFFSRSSLIFEILSK